MADEKKKDPSEVLIDREWRILLVVLGVTLLMAAALSWWSPPTKVEFAPQAATSGSSTTANVEDRSDTTTGLVLGLAVLCILIAANGRKFTSVKIAGQEVDTGVANLAGEAKGVARERAREQGLPPAAADEAGNLVEAQVYGAALPETAVHLDDLPIDALVQSAVWIATQKYAPTTGPGTPQ